MQNEIELQTKTKVLNSTNEPWWMHLTDKTCRIMREHYKRNISYVMDELTEDVMWIGPMDHQFLIGKDKFYEVICKERDIFCDITKEEYHLIWNNEDTAIVIGRILVHTRESTRMLIEVKQRVTFQYVLVENVPKVSHMHVSNNWDIAQPNEYFPYYAGRQTYQYMQRLLLEHKKLPRKLTLVDNRKDVHFIMESEILYIQANNDKCIIYYMDGRIEITDTMSHFYSELSDAFLWIHRSYIINMDYVIGVERFLVRLCDGIRIPIPEKRYTKVKNTILNWGKGERETKISLLP